MPKRLTHISDGKQLARYLRWVYEIALSVYCAGLIMLHNESGQYIAMVYVRRLPTSLLRRARDVFSSDGWFNLWYLSWLLLAGAIFILFRTLAQIPILSKLLYRSAGAFIALAPLVFQCAGGVVGTPQLIWAPCLETAAIAAIAFNADRKWAAAAGALALHLAVWGFVPLFQLGRTFNASLWEYRNWLPEYLGLPLAGAAVWLACVRLLPPRQV